MNCRQVFRFRDFSLCQDGASLKITTDTILTGLLAPVEKARRILDIGTGTGAIALLAARRAPHARVDALEPHSPSAELAARNFSASPYAERLRLIPLPLEDFEPEGPYDAIVTNPPFHPSLPDRPNPAKDAAFLPPETLTDFAARHLTTNGILTMIYPSSRTPEVLEAAYTHRLFPMRKILIRDHPCAPAKRTVWVFTPRWERDFRAEELTLFDRSGKRTPAFEALASPYLPDPKDL
ncbi:MAG: methyltransferase [Chlorobi bacterium]|nr:methyltransferase [Chlorobiota bacterium]